MNALSDVRRSACLMAAAAILALGSGGGAAFAQPTAPGQLPGQLPGAPGGTAKKEKEFKPPAPLPPSAPPSAPLQMAVGVLLLALLMGVSCIPSKRGHQD